MPRTRSTRAADTITPAEKLARIDSVIDRYIFFEYYDGYATNGLIGFQISNEPLPRNNLAGPLGSVKHKNARNILGFMTGGQFRGKGKKLALLAKAFIDNNEAPAQDMRPRLDLAIPIAEMQPTVNADRRTPMEKLVESNDIIDRFIFYKYYDGLATGGRVGFSPRAGPPGSINHKRAHTALNGLAATQFRNKGKAMGDLAKEFIEKGVVPPELLRPAVVQRHVPAGLLRGAAAAARYI
jgi:hypothetical protein